MSNVKVNGKLNNKDQVMDIVKVNKFILQRKKLENFDKKAKTWVVKTGD